MYTQNRYGIVQAATEFYKSFYRKEDNEEEKEERIEVEVEPIPPILQREVSCILKNLKTAKSERPDKISNTILRAFSKESTPILTQIFNKIIDQEEILIQWKEAEIILLFQKGDEKVDISNHRLISLTSNISNIFSKLITTRLCGILDETRSPEHVGFHRNRSTIHRSYLFNQPANRESERISIFAAHTFHRLSESIRYSKAKLFMKGSGAARNSSKMYKDFKRNVQGSNS